jgi:hypothetical protein
MKEHIHRILVSYQSLFWHLADQRELQLQVDPLLVILAFGHRVDKNGHSGMSQHPDR